MDRQNDVSLSPNLRFIGVISNQYPFPVTDCYPCSLRDPKNQNLFII